MNEQKNVNVVWKPQEKQAYAMSCPADELFYGGAAGGGKSDFLLGDFLQGANKYGKNWHGVLFRRTNPQLEELQKRAMELFPVVGAEYKKYTRTWYFPNGATLKMRYLESESDVENYQGHQYTWIGFDELGNYPTSYCWIFMTSRLRSAAGVPCYIRGTGNPGGVGHSWIKHYFMDNHEPNKIFYLPVTDLKGNPIKDKEGNPMKKSVVFIPSRLEDNKILMDNDPNYEARLATLPEHLARAMRYGDWSVFSGQVFSEFNTDRHVVRPFALQPGVWFKFCALDWGYTKPYSLGWYAVNGDGRVVKYREWYGCEQGEQNVGVKESSKSLARRAWEISCTEGVVDMVADPAIWGKQDEISSICDNFIAEGWKMHKGNNDRVNGLQKFHNYLQESCDEDGTPMLTIFPTCYGFIRTIPMLTPNPNHPEDIDTRLEDHIYDETRYALMSDFVKAPARQFKKQFGQWEEVQTQAEEYNPYDFM